MNMRDSGKTPPRVLGDTGRGALYALLDRAMPGAPSLFPFVHEAAEPLVGGIISPPFIARAGNHSRRKPCPVLVPGVRITSSRTLGAKLSCLPDQRQDRITERKI